MSTESTVFFDIQKILRNWQSPRLAIAAIALMLVLSLTAKERNVINDFESPTLFESVNSVDEIRLTKFNQEIVIKKKGNLWKIPSSHNYDANPAFVDEFLSALKKLKIQRPVTRKSDKFASFQVDDKGLKAQLFGGGKELGAVILGRAGVDPKTLFIRMPKADQVFTAGPNSASFQKQNATAWMEKRLLPKLATTKIRQLEFFKSGKLELALLRDGGLEDKPIGVGWTIKKPIEHLARETSITRLINQVSDLSLSQAALPDAPTTQTGLDKPVIEVSLRMNNGKVNSLKFGRAQANMAFVSSSMRQGIFMVPGYLLDRIIPKPESLKENDVLTLKPNKVLKLELVKPKARCVLERSSAKAPWKMTEPDASKCDGRSVSKVLSFVSALRFIDKVPSPGDTKIGLDNPLLTLTVFDDLGGSQTLRFSKVVTTTTTKDKEYVYIRKNKEKELYLVDAAAFKKLKSEPKDFRGSLFNFASSNIVLLQRLVRGPNKSNKVTFLRKRQTFWEGTIDGNLWHGLDVKKVNELVKAISQFKRGQLAEQQDHKVYDMRNAKITWAIQLKNNSRHMLHVGKTLPSGKVPVTNERMLPIYLVDSEDIEILKLGLNEDLRNRKLFDLNFVDIHLNEIVLTHLNKGKITLNRKGDNSWVISNPNAPADSDRVKELAKNLNKLRADAVRFAGRNTADQAERSKLLQNREYEIRLLYRNMVNATIFVGPLRPNGTRLIAKPRGGVVDALFEVKEAEMKKVLLRLSDLRTGQFIGPIANEATAIDIFPKGKPERRFVRKDNNWVQRTGSARIDQSALRGAISQFVNMKPIEGLKVKKDHGLKSPIGKLVLTTPNRTFNILIGKPGPKPGTRHIQFQGQKEIHIVRCYVFEQMATNNPDYVDLKLIPDYYTTFNKVTWTLPSGKIVITKDQKRNVWNVTEPKIAKTDNVALSQHLSLLGNMRALKYEVSTAAIQSATSSNPEITVLIERANNKTPFELKIYKAVEAQRRVVSTSDRKKPLFLPQSTLSFTLPDLKKFTDLNIYECDINKIDSITVQLPGLAPRTFRVSGGTWFDVKSKELVDRYVIVRLTSAFRKLRREGPIPPDVAAGINFAKPLITMSIKIGNEVNTITVGKLDKTKRFAYVKFNNGEGFVTSINSFYSVENLNARSFENLLVATFNIANIKKLAFKKGPQSITIERERNRWILNPGNIALRP
ncbi:MAG: DUF4340 domain-containing protein, partial [Planctomycetota bacterium]|nr:DUF4340 domain-containing protein [Planctomycetota bacterium]